MMAEVKDGPTLERDFSKVILTLDNVLIPPDKLSPTPSLQDGLDLDTETDLRILGCELIQTAGILLKLPQVAMATGQVVYQRFYYSKSFVKHNMEVLAMACVNLASKIEEAPRRIRDVINVFHHVKQVRNGKTIQPLILDQHYINLKNQVIKAERRILKELGFCVHVQHPHKSIVMFLQVLECEKNRRLVQTAWNYMNDSFRTNVFVQFQPETIGCACIYLAARQLQIPLPNSPPWYSLFGVGEEELQEICMSILKLYARPKPNYDELEKIVNEAKKIQIEAKLKAKGLSSEQGTPTYSNSRPCTPKNVSPNPALITNMRKIKSEVDLHENSTPVEKNHSKKRSRSPDRHGGSSKSLSSRSHSSRSRSRSLSPPSKSRKYRSPPKKQKKDRFSPDRYREKHHSHKHDKRRKRSFSRSRSRSISPSPDHRHGHKKYYKDKVRYRSPEPHRRSHKHRNGHNSPIRDKYSKYYHR